MGEVEGVITVLNLAQKVYTLGNAKCILIKHITIKIMRMHENVNAGNV